MLIEMLRKHFFNLCINDMAAYDRIKLLCVKKYLLCTLSRSRLVQTIEGYRSILKLNCKPLAFTLHKLF